MCIFLELYIDDIIIHAQTEDLNFSSSSDNSAREEFFLFVSASGASYYSKYLRRYI